MEKFLLHAIAVLRWVYKQNLYKSRAKPAGTGNRIFAELSPVSGYNGPAEVNAEFINPPRDEVETMPDALSVRTGQEKDIDTLVKFNIALAHETEQKQLSPPIVTKGVQMLFNNPRYGFYVIAETEDEIVGCCMVTYEWSDWRCGLFWWIQSVYVRPGFRRRGIFRKLYEFLKQKASQERNICGFRLYVEQSNHTGQNTYAGVGMKQSPYKFYEESFQD